MFLLRIIVKQYKRDYWKTYQGNHEPVHELVFDPKRLMFALTGSKKVVAVHKGHRSVLYLYYSLHVACFKYR